MLLGEISISLRQIYAQSTLVMKSIAWWSHIEYIAAFAALARMNVYRKKDHQFSNPG